MHIPKIIDAKMKTNYKEQLADSRWLRKKNEILERDNYTCQKCGAKSHLNVHHLNYEKGKLAWEYPNESLLTLCSKCHISEHLITRAVIGEVYTYEHSDFTNYMICYGINYQKKEVYLLGYDNGGSVNTTIFECVKLDIFQELFCHCIDFWSDLESEYDDYIAQVLLKDLVRLYEKPHNSYYVFNGFVYSQKMIINYARKSIGRILNNSDILKRFFENDIQGFYIED